MVIPPEKPLAGITVYEYESRLFGKNWDALKTEIVSNLDSCSQADHLRVAGLNSVSDKYVFVRVP